MRKGAAARELAREHSARFVVAGYRLVSRAQYLLSFRRKRLTKGAYFWYKAQDSLWWLGKIHAPGPDSDDGYYIRFLDDPGANADHAGWRLLQRSVVRSPRVLVSTTT